MTLSPRDRVRRIVGSAAALLAAAGPAGPSQGGAAAPQVTALGESVVVSGLATGRGSVAVPDVVSGAAAHIARRPRATGRTPTAGPVRVYAMREAAARGWTGSHWRALEAIVRPESGWDPCAVYPQRHSCAYGGAESCGLPQAQPCPAAWRGRLWQVRFAQVRWLLDYIARRYGNPQGALHFRHAHAWY
jgi:hypothetical protein